MILKQALLGGLLVITGTLIAAQTPVPTPPLTRPSADDRTTPTAVPHARRPKTVLGSRVMIENGISIGTVDDIIFDDDGYIEYLIVLNDGKMVAVPWQAAKFNFDQRQAVVNITETKYREIPTFSVQTYPNFYEPAYRSRIYTYYGLTPRDGRVHDRRRP